MPGNQTTISAKVPKRLKEELERRGVKLSEAVRRGLEKELKELKIKELESLLEKTELAKVTEDRIVRDIRETREER